MDERKLFNLIKEKIIPDLEKTDQYSYKDATSKEFEMVLELKCRRQHHRFLILEKEKYDKLILNKNPRYINSIPVYPYQNTFEVYSWNLKKLENPRWIQKWCKETTDFGPDKYILKWVTMFDIHKEKNLSSKLFN